MTPQFRNLIFEGGGIRGIAYIGALEILSQRGHLDHLTRVGGTSAGAIEERCACRYNEPPRGKPIKRFSHYAKALLTAVMNAQEKQHLKSNDWQRTVYINTLDVGTSDFEISSEKKQCLVEQGIEGTETYLQWFEGQGEHPVNRFEPAVPANEPGSQN